MEPIPILRIFSSRLPYFPEAAFIQGHQLETQTKASDSSLSLGHLVFLSIYITLTLWLCVCVCVYTCG